jgi:hypothetical protein
MCAAVETVQEGTVMRAFRGHTVRLIGTIGHFTAGVVCESRSEFGARHRFSRATEGELMAASLLADPARLTNSNQNDFEDDARNSKRLFAR